MRKRAGPAAHGPGAITAGVTSHSSSPPAPGDKSPTFASATLREPDPAAADRGRHERREEGLVPDHEHGPGRVERREPREDTIHGSAGLELVPGRERGRRARTLEDEGRRLLRPGERTRRHQVERDLMVPHPPSQPARVPLPLLRQRTGCVVPVRGRPLRLRVPEDVEVHAVESQKNDI